MADPLATPDRAEHHYRYAPAKATSYTSTTLSWVGDPAAVDVAREVIAALSGDGDGARQRRLAVCPAGPGPGADPAGPGDEAAQAALDAIVSGRVAPSNRWRALEVARTVEAAGAGEAVLLKEAYRELSRSPL